MEKLLPRFLAVGILVSTALIAACGTSKYKAADTRPVTVPPPQSGTSPGQLYKEINLVKRYIPKGRYGRRHHRSMKPRYITVHSTQNYSGDAWDHARALENGKLRARQRKGGNRIGYLTWHFTVQDNVAIQHLPVTEQGEHADFDGPGNNYSIGIEMCEHRGNSRSQTIIRTAKLCASLMHKYNIPLENVVPHYHWPRKGKSPEHKNCPHYLMDNGRPGHKWKGFLGQVDGHYDRITKSKAPLNVSNPW